MSHDHAPVLSAHSSSGVPLVGVLHEGVALVDGAAHDLAVFGEDGLDVGFGDQQSVEVPDEDPGVEGAGVGLVGNIAAGHEGGGGGRATEGTHTEIKQSGGKKNKKDLLSVLLKPD